jgi:hypothetical protein
MTKKRTLVNKKTGKKITLIKKKKREYERKKVKLKNLA